MQIDDLDYTDDSTTKKIELTCIDTNHQLLYEGDFVSNCQLDGTWDNTNIPQCVIGKF